MWMTEREWWRITTTVGVVSIGRGSHRLMGSMEDCYTRGWDCKVEFFEEEPDVDKPAVDTSEVFPGAS